MRRIRIFFSALAVAGLLAAPAMARSSTTTSGMTNVEAESAPPMVDVLFYRPFGLVGLAAASAFWVPAEAITLLVDPTSWKAPVDALLIHPARFVFVDPIGSH